MEEIISSIPDSIKTAGYISILILALFIGAYLYYKINKGFEKNKIKKRFKRGQEGEKQAEKFLIKNGFTILEDQVQIHPKMCVDGNWSEYMIKVDYLVEKNGKQAIVEVKTGNSAPSPKNSSTRRQILEYSCTYDVDTVYLFDAEQSKLMEIQFDLKQQNLNTGNHYFKVFMIGLILGLIISSFVWYNLR